MILSWRYLNTIFQCALPDMNILFRVDSSVEIGLGHLMRCLVLAKQYEKEHAIFFAVQNLTGNANQRIIDLGYQLILLRNNSIDELAACFDRLKIDMVVFDHYGIDDRFEKTVKDRTGVTILSLDDTYQRHYCDILLNHNIYAQAGHYQGLVPDFCELRCGGDYTLIRDEFKSIKIKDRPIDKNNPRFFVSLGGVDTANINLTALNTLSDFGQVSVNLAITSANQHRDELIAFANQHPLVNICVDCNIAELMNDSDFAIITPSVITYEAMYLNIPFIAIQTADNQRYVADYLAGNDFLVTDVSKIDELDVLIRALLK